MPLDAARLSEALRVRLLGNDASAATDNDALIALCDEIAGAIVDEITANAVVVPTLLLAPPGTAGGPVTGTGGVT